MKDGVEHIWLCRFDGSPVWDLLYKKRDGRSDLGNLALEIAAPFFPTENLSVPINEDAKYWHNGVDDKGVPCLGIFLVPLLNLHGSPPIQHPNVEWRLFERKAIKGDAFGWEVQHVL